MLEQANRTEAPHAAEHGYRTIGDIMRSLNPLEGEFYREALQVSRSTREMFCLMEGRHVHPSTLYPGGVGTVATVQLFTDYLTRLMRYVEFMKRVVPMHDDLFDFFYEALPGYEEVGRRRVLLGCWGSLNDPEHCDFSYENMTDWGRKMFVTPGVIVDGKLVTNDLVEINLGIRILLGSSYLRGLGGPGDVRHPGPAGQPGRPQRTRGTSTRSRGRRSATSTTSTAGSCRRAGSTAQDHLPLDTGGGPIARLWATALGGLVDFGYVKSTGHSVQINLPRTMSQARGHLRVEDPVDKEGSRCPTRSSGTGPGPTSRPTAAAAARCTSSSRRWPRSGPAGPRPGSRSTCPDEAFSCGFTEAVRGVLSHHMVIRAARSRTTTRTRPRRGTPASATSTGRRGRTRTRCRTRRSSRRTRRRTSRASTSCAPCAASTRACRAGAHVPGRRPGAGAGALADAATTGRLGAH